MSESNSGASETPREAPVTQDADGGVASLRCTAVGDPCYSRQTIEVCGAREQQRPTISDAANTEYLSARAMEVLQTSAGGGARRGAKVGDNVLVYITAVDRGHDTHRQLHRDDSTAAESVVVPAKVSCALRR